MALRSAPRLRRVRRYFASRRIFARFGDALEHRRVVVGRGFARSARATVPDRPAARCATARVRHRRTRTPLRASTRLRAGRLAAASPARAASRFAPARARRSPRHSPRPSASPCGHAKRDARRAQVRPRHARQHRLRAYPACAAAAAVRLAPQLVQSCVRWTWTVPRLRATCSCAALRRASPRGCAPVALLPRPSRDRRGALGGRRSSTHGA